MIGGRSPNRRSRRASLRHLASTSSASRLSLVLLLSDHNAASFDGRYFGPVAATCLQGVVVPVWVFGREAAR